MAEVASDNAPLEAQLPDIPVETEEEGRHHASFSSKSCADS